MDDAASGEDVLGVGVAAGPGQGIGELHVDIDDALDAIDAGRPVVVALGTTSPGDVSAMVRAAGVLTTVGGLESHAAVVTRSAGVPAVVSVQGLTISAEGIRISAATVMVGEAVVVDGTRGEIRRSPH